MARTEFSVELGLRLFGENGDTYSALLRGNGAPAGGGTQDEAQQGSLFLDETNGALYIKFLAGSGADRWRRMAKTEDVGLAIRGKLKVVTNDPQGPGVRDLTATPFIDDDGIGIDASSFVVGDSIISDANGTPALLEVTAVSAPNVTFAAATPVLQDLDNFVTRYYLPDPAGQENQALVQYLSAGPSVVKIADADWAFANAIDLAAGYSPVNGDPAAGDSVQLAIEKLDGNQDDIQTTLGVPQGSVDMGTFTGATIPDNSTTKEALQSLETAVETLDAKSQAVGVSSPTVLDEVLVDDVLACEWEIVATLDSDPSRKKFFKMSAIHNGTASADATNTDDNTFSRLRLGANFNTDRSTALNGSGPTQTMQLIVDSSTPGVTYTARRTSVVAP